MKLQSSLKTTNADQRTDCGKLIPFLVLEYLWFMKSSLTRLQSFILMKKNICLIETIRYILQPSLSQQWLILLKEV